jgi:hypothetical protein
MAGDTVSFPTSVHQRSMQGQQPVRLPNVRSVYGALPKFMHYNLPREAKCRKKSDR